MTRFFKMAFKMFGSLAAGPNSVRGKCSTELLKVAITLLLSCLFPVFHILYTTSAQKAMKKGNKCANMDIHTRSFFTKKNVILTPYYSFGPKFTATDSLHFSDRKKSFIFITLRGE